MKTKTRWWALTAVSLATLMTNLDGDVTFVALPTIERSLHLSIAGLEWIIGSYLLVFAGLLLVGGRVADLYGRRRVFYAGLSIFTLSSLAAGLAGSGGQLIAARAVQGLGAALLAPTTLAILTDGFTDVKERTVAIGILSAVGAVSLALGPVIGGVISQHLYWGWIFLLNVPLGVVTFSMAVLFIAESSGESPTRRLDLAGLITTAIALFALTYALIEGQDGGWTSAPIVAAFGLAVLAAAIFLIVDSRTPEPMVPLQVFRNASFSGGIITTMIWGFGIMGIYFFTSLYVQGILGFSPTKAGLAFVPMALCVVIASVIAPRVVDLLGSHRTIPAGLALMVVGLLLFVRLGAAARFRSLLPAFALFGAGAGLMIVPLTNSVLQTVSRGQAGVAAAVFNASRQLSGLLGVAVIGAVVRSVEAGALRGGAAMPQAFLSGYHAGIWVTITLLAASVVLSHITLRPHAQARSAVSVSDGHGSRPDPGALRSDPVTSRRRTSL